MAICDDEWTGQPSTSGTAMSRAWVQDLILGHWQVTIRDLLGVTNLATGTVHSSVHAVSLQHLAVTLFDCSRIQPYIRQTKLAIFQLQTDTQNLMTGLDLAFTGKKHLDLLTAKTLFELPEMYLSQNFHPGISLLAENGNCCTSLTWKGWHQPPCRWTWVYYSSNLLHWIKTAYFSINTIPFLSQKCGKAILLMVSSARIVIL